MRLLIRTAPASGRAAPAASRTAQVSGRAAKPQPRAARRRRRRLIQAAVAAASLAVIFGAGSWMARTGRLTALSGFVQWQLARAVTPLGLKVENVSVEGRGRVPAAAILKALDLARGTPILAVDLSAAKARIEALPWVRSAAIERRLPATIFVRLTERQPLAFWQSHNKLALIDHDGKVIPDQTLSAFGALIVLVGEDAPQKGAALLDMLATEPALARQVTAAVRVGGRRWNLELDNGIQVALPETDPESAWHRLAGLERKDQLLQRDIRAVDLRLPDRLVVRVPPAPKPEKRRRQPGKAT